MAGDCSVVIEMKSARPVSDEDLNAYIDGQLPHNRRRDIERLIAIDGHSARGNLGVGHYAPGPRLPQEFSKDNVEIEIIAFGPGLAMLKSGSEVDKRLSEAAQVGVLLRACGKTMKAQKVAKADLHAGVGVVPAGVVEIIAKTQSGWTYIRP